MRSTGMNRMEGGGLRLEKVLMHYNNGVYMGGMDCFKRTGKGIVLQDEGACCLCEYSYDTMTGHNVVYRQDMVISAIVSKNGNT